jgi:microcin C transport system permease protein
MFKKLKNNKKSSYSFIIFICIFVFSIFIDLISNDKPLFVKYDGNFYYPIIKKYSEKTFGGNFKSEADYLDPFVQSKIKEKGFFVMPLLHYSYDTINYQLNSPPPTSPTFKNILGTDDQARDVFARLFYGLRISLVFGILLTLISSVIGIFIGAIQGYYGGRFDIIMQRFTEIWSSLPVIFILIIMAGFINPGFFSLLFIFVMFSWMSLTGPVRAEFLKARKQEFVMAAKSAGISELRIIFKHILPNALVATKSFVPFILAGSIITLTSLDFLGFGLQAGSPSLGELLTQAKNNPESYAIAISSFLTLATILTLIIFASNNFSKKN